MSRVWRRLLVLEWGVLLVPAAVASLMAGRMALLAAFPTQGVENEAPGGAIAIVFFGGLFLLGATAAVEVGLAAWATARGRALAPRRRSAISVMAVIGGVALGSIGTWLQSDGNAGLEPMALSAAIAAPLLLLELQVRWRQRRLAGC